MPEAVVGSAEPCLKIAGVANVDGAIATVQKNGHGTRRIRARLALSAAGAGSAPAAFGLIPLGGSPSDRAAGPGSGQPEGAGGGGRSRRTTCLRYLYTAATELSPQASFRVTCRRCIEH